MSVVAIIPARLKSNRFPNKLLTKFLGKYIIDHVIENTLKLDFVNDVVVATDSFDITTHVRKKYQQIEVVHIHSACCGTHRVYKYYTLNNSYDFYLSIPCDEPVINPDEINNYVRKNRLMDSYITTFYTKFYNKNDLESPLSCKIVTDDHGFMLYNSRAIVPVQKDGTTLPLEEYKKHVGIFIFPNWVLQRFGQEFWSQSKDLESLEQNRFLQFNISIMTKEIKHIGFGIDVPSQIKQLETRMIDNETFNNRTINNN